MSRAEEKRRAIKEAEEANEKLLMDSLKEVAPPSAPISKPEGFKKAYPKMFKAILDAAIMFHDKKSKQ